MIFLKKRKKIEKTIGGDAIWDITRGVGVTAADLIAAHTDAM